MEIFETIMYILPVLKSLKRLCIKLFYHDVNLSNDCVYFNILYLYIIISGMWPEINLDF